MIGGLKRWTIVAKRYSDSDWVEVCRCDSHPEQLRDACVLVKGYDRASFVDNWEKFARGGQIDWAAAMTEIFGLKVKYVKANPAEGAAP
jgi:hypothetical protein